MTTPTTEEWYRWDGEDSVFEGTLQSRHKKRNGKPMVVLEDDRGLQHIYPDNPNRLHRIEPPEPVGLRVHRL